MRERKKEKRRKNKIEIYTFNFFNCEKDSWNFESVFYIRIAKGIYP